VGANAAAPTHSAGRRERVRPDAQSAHGCRQRRRVCGGLAGTGEELLWFIRVTRILPHPGADTEDPEFEWRKLNVLMSRQWGWSFGALESDSEAAQQGGSRAAAPSTRPPSRSGGAAAPPVAAPAAQPPVCNGAVGGAAGGRDGGSKPPAWSAQAKTATGATAGVPGAQRPRAQPTAAVVVDTPCPEDAGGEEAVSPGGNASQCSDFDEGGGDLDELVANAQSVMAAAEAATARLLEQRDKLQPGTSRTHCESDDDSDG
jgi:hypothetical protein